MFVVKWIIYHAFKVSVTDVKILIHSQGEFLVFFVVAVEAYTWLDFLESPVI